MKHLYWLVMILILALPLVFSGGCEADGNTPSPSAGGEVIALPEPAYESDVSLEEALLARRTSRHYGEGALTLKEVGQLLWAAQGVTDPSGKRTAPSAGAMYPLELYVVVGDAGGLADGVYKYRPDSHTLVKVLDGDRRGDLSGAADGQDSVRQGAIDIVVTAVFTRVTNRYGERGIRFTHLEAGHAAQNVCLQAAALKLGTVTVGSFDDDDVQEVLGAAVDEVPLYILPVGRKAD